MVAYGFPSSNDNLLMVRKETVKLCFLIFKCVQMPTVLHIQQAPWTSSAIPLQHSPHRSANQIQIPNYF